MATQPSKVSPFGIIGDDGRAQVTNVNAYPYSAIVYLTITRADGKVTHGSGAMVGRDLVLTAAHCVYDMDLGWSKSINVKPGGVNSKFDSTNATTYYASSVYTSGGYESYDYAAIKLDSTRTGQLTGYYGTRWFSLNASLAGQDMYVYGYPYDKPDGTMWYGTGTISNVQSMMFDHNADTESNMSGGPVVLTSEWDRIVGIHTRGNTTSNRAVRMTESIFNFISEHTSAS